MDQDGVKFKVVRRGRPRLPGYDALQRLERRRAQKRKSDQSRIRIGTETNRWLKIKNENGLRKDSDVAKLLMDSYEFMQQGCLALVSSTRETVVRSSGENSTKDTNGSEMTGVESKCQVKSAVTEVEPHFQVYTTEASEVESDCQVKSKVTDGESHSQVNTSKTTEVESNCQVTSEVTEVESNNQPVVELIVIPPCGSGGDEENSPSDWSSDEEDVDSDPLGLKDGMLSEEEYLPEDSDFGSDSDGLKDNGTAKGDAEWMPASKVEKKEKKTTKEKMEKRVKLESKEEQEEINNDPTEITWKRRRYRRRKQTWRDLDRTFLCQICSFQCSDVFHICEHLLQAHLGVVSDLVTYFKERPASNSESGVTLYDILMLHSKFESQQRREGDVHGKGEVKKEEGEMKSPDISPGGGETGRKTDAFLNMQNLFNEAEIAEFLLRWVKLNIYCRYCQRNALRLGLRAKSGREAIHMCSIIEDTDDGETELNNFLCEVCGKSFPRDHLRNQHLKQVHNEERGPCHICGKILKLTYINFHISTTHIDALLPCGICGKNFKTKYSREKHAAIHNEAKPFKCDHCPRRFAQCSNMKHHMRQHTGEKPYECDKCAESFTHKVSLKNHLKKKHDIDLWKMGYTGGGRPKQDE